MAAGESFVFGLGGQQATVTASGTAVAFGTALASGSSYTTTQVSGPRSCTLSPNRSGTLTANVSVTADCGTPPASRPLGVRFYGPAGAQATLQNNGGDDLQVSVPTTFAYDSKTFSFATPVPDGSSYNVTLRSSGPNLDCRVFKGATGTTPIGADALRVGCETVFDRITRSTDDRQQLTFFETTAPVIGGANVPIGNGSTAYGEGRFVAFVSSAAIAGASGARRQVFLRDRFTGELFLVSAVGGAEGNGASDNPAISADGLTVVFESSASNLVSGDSNGVQDVFAYSLLDQTLSRVSVGAGGVEFTSPSGKPTVSGDGRVVAFETIRSNLGSNVAGSDNTTVVVRRDRSTGALAAISRNLSGQATGGLVPSISEDGNRIAFWSFASDLVAGDGNGLWDIFVADVSAGSMQRVSLTAAGGERNQGSESSSRVVMPTISGDGRWVAYATTASNVVPGDTNGTQDVFVVDTQSGAVHRASVATSGAQADADAPIAQGDRIGLSRDGVWVAFTSTAGNLGAATTTTTGIGNVFLHNRVTGETRSASKHTSAGSVGFAPALSRDGAYLVFGASTALDPRFPGSGQFVHFTGITRAFYWLPD